MRLNRVLQITAAISVAMVATVFIACGSDGESGKDGASCTVASNPTGYDVLCGGAKVGELQSGGVGAEGPQGPTGNDGTDGYGCVLGDKVGTSYQIICNGQNRGTLDNCTASDSANVISIKCGSTNVSFCENPGQTEQKPFDPEVEECQAAGTVLAITLYCDEENQAISYTPKTQYCGYASKLGAEFGIATSLPDSLHALSYCIGETEKLKPNNEDITEWKDQYCKVVITKDPITGVATKTVTLGEPDSTCASPVKNNDGAWKGEYCGYAGTTATTKTQQNNACDDGKGPHEVAYYNGYCKQDAGALATVLASPDDFCGIAANVIRDSTNTRVNEVPCLGGFCNCRHLAGGGVCDTASAGYTPGNVGTAPGVVGEHSYKYEYCGYDVTGAVSNADTYNSATPQKLEALQGITVDPEVKLECSKLKPNAEKPGADPLDADFPTYFARAIQYCSVSLDGTVSLDTQGNNDCGTTVGTDLVPAADPVPTKLNEGVYLGEYCGYQNPTSATATTAKGKITAGSPTATALIKCYSLKPNTELLSGTTQEKQNAVQYCTVNHEGVFSLAKPSDNDCSENGAKLNENTWLGEYCGYKTAAATKKTKITPTVAQGGGACGLLQPNSETQPADNEDVQYCTVDKDGKMSLAKPSDNDCVGNAVKLNEGSWKGDYCGYASATAANKTKITPNANQGGKDCGALAPNSKELPASALDLEYCTVASPGAPLSLAKVSDTPCNKVLNQGKWNNDFCVPADAASATWKVISCKGGLVGNPDYAATSATQCIYPDLLPE